MVSRVLTVISFVGVLGIPSPLRAQAAKVQTLDAILKQLETNLNDYDSNVPSFFCDEHVVSSVRAPGLRDQDTVTDSIFRLKRTPSPDHTSTLVESRDIMKVDGKPATKQQMNGPTLLEGAFEGGLAVVSATQATCTNYELQPIHKGHSDRPYIVSFATTHTSQDSADCLLQETSRGRAFIDQASMQMTRLELTTPHHTITSGSDESAVIGERVIVVDYAPVLLGNESFWMPSTITLRVTSGAGTFHRQVWSFRATYRNYRKLGVSSRIVSGSETVVP